MDNLSITGTAQSAFAVCDPRVVAGALFSDEAAYRDKHVPLRMSWDEATLPILTYAAFLFDTVIAEPVLFVGLEEILGHTFFDLFGNTLKKVQKSGFMAFNTTEYLSESRRARFEELRKFLAKVQESESAVRALAGDTSVSFSAPIESALLYSQLAKIPFIGPDGYMAGPGFGNSVLAQRSDPFTVLSQVLSIELPNLHVTTLDDVLDIRTTKGAKEFRQIVQNLLVNLNKEVMENPGDNSRILENWTRVKNQAVDVLADEFRSEIRGWARVKAGFSILLDIAGFIPGISIATGAVSTTKDTIDFVKMVSKRKRMKDVGFLCFLAEMRSKNLLKDTDA